MEWWRTALNGGSTRVALPCPTEDFQPDDMLAGKLVEIGKSSFVLAIETGTFNGEPLEPGEWRRVYWRHVGVLQRWMRDAKPVEGERVALQYQGVHRNKRCFAVGVWREPEKEASSPWAE
jgi:hypothetical protein